MTHFVTDAFKTATDYGKNLLQGGGKVALTNGASVLSQSLANLFTPTSLPSPMLNLQELIQQYLHQVQTNQPKIQSQIQEPLYFWGGGKKTANLYLEGFQDDIRKKENDISFWGNAQAILPIATAAASYLARPFTKFLPVVSLLTHPAIAPLLGLVFASWKHRNACDNLVNHQMGLLANVHDNQSPLLRSVNELVTVTQNEQREIKPLASLDSNKLATTFKEFKTLGKDPLEISKHAFHNRNHKGEVIGVLQEVSNMSQKNNPPPLNPDNYSNTIDYDDAVLIHKAENSVLDNLCQSIKLQIRHDLKSLYNKIHRAGGIFKDRGMYAGLAFKEFSTLCKTTQELAFKYADEYPQIKSLIDALLRQEFQKELKPHQKTGAIIS